MATKAKPPKRGAFILGRNRFAKICEIEGIKLSHRMREELDALKQAGVSGEERRRILLLKFGHKV